MECRKSGQFQNGGHTDGKNREEGDSTKIPAEFGKAFPAADLITEEQQENENTSEKSNIIVGKNGKKQGKGIKNKLLFF